MTAPKPLEDELNALDDREMDKQDESDHFSAIEQTVDEEAEVEKDLF